MRRPIFALLCVALFGASPVVAQQPPAAQQAPEQDQPQTLAPPRSYQPVPIKLSPPLNDPSFDSFRKQLADVAARKDRAALAKLVVSKGFFWEGENGDKFDKRRSALENLAAALGLNAKDTAGWGALSLAASDSTLEPMEGRKGVMCGPAGPEVDEQATEALTKATGTTSEEWGFTTADGLEVRAAPLPNAPIIEKLGLQLVRVLPDESDGAAGSPQGNTQENTQGNTQGDVQAPMIRVVAPSGKVGYLPAEAVAPLTFEQLCYSKEGSSWKIVGYVDGDTD